MGKEPQNIYEEEALSTTQVSWSQIELNEKWRFTRMN
jgi:hypothetical protein